MVRSEHRLWRNGAISVHDLSVCRQQFPSLTRTTASHEPLIYLDGPGGSQVPYGVIGAIAEYYMHRNANTHGQFITSEESDAVIAQARSDVKAFLAAPETGSISFGQNMTTLNFLLSQAIGATLKPGDEIIVTDLDHDSNVAPWLALAARGAVIRRVPITASATLDMDAFKRLFSDKTRLVAVGWASNAVGTVNPLPTIRAWAKEAGSLFLVDAVHWAPHGPINATQLDPDFLLCSAYKFFGPHIGILYSKKGQLEALPTLRVRPQAPTAPERIETGTLNHAALAGVSAAIQFIASLSDQTQLGWSDRIHQAMENIYAYEHKLAKRLYTGLLTTPGVSVYGPAVGDEDRAPTVSFTMEDRSSEDVARALGHRGILAWDGDFYAMTLVDELGIRGQAGLVRLGLAPYNTMGEIERTLTVIREVAAHGA